MNNIDHTVALAEYASCLRFEDLPAPVVNLMKQCVLDTLGCGVFGASTPQGKIISKYARRTAGSCVVWGTDGSSDAPNAAMANGTMTHSFELDDLHPSAYVHPGGVTVPVALALAGEERGMSGRDMLTAVAAGYEVLCRVSSCLGVSTFFRGFHPTGTSGAFGATATASRLLGLPFKAMQNALGIGGALGAGLQSAQYGAMVKRLYPGHASLAGILAARLAADGFTGIPNIFDSEFASYPKTLSDKYDLDILTDGLGKEYVTLGVGHKLYSCAGANHTTLDAVRKILEERPTRPEEVASIHVRTSEFQKIHAGHDYVPDSAMTAQMNIHYTVSVLITEGDAFVEQFTEDKLARPDLLALAAKIQIDADRTIDDSGHERLSIVDLVRTDGSTGHAEVEFARGTRQNPCSWEDLERKFRRLVKGAMSSDRADEIVGFVANLENQTDVSGLAKLMASDRK